MKKLFAVLMVAGSLFACEDDEAPMSDIFTIEIGEGYLPQHADNWILVSSTDGQLLDYQSLQTGTIILQTSEVLYSGVDEVIFPVLLNFPEELVAENPVLSTDNLVNTYNRFLFNIDGQSYQDFLDKVIRQPSATKRLEEVYQLTKF